MTTTITAALLLIGACLAAFGTLAFLAATPAAADPDGTNPSAPDPETLRLTWVAALRGRHIAGLGLSLWMIAHPAMPAPCTPLIFAAFIAVAASYITTRAAPEMIRRAAPWAL